MSHLYFTTIPKVCRGKNRAKCETEEKAKSKEVILYILDYIFIKESNGVGHSRSRKQLDQGSM